MSTLETNLVQPSTGTTLTLGAWRYNNCSIQEQLLILLELQDYKYKNLTGTKDTYSYRLQKTTTSRLFVEAYTVDITPIKELILAKILIL